MKPGMLGIPGIMFLNTFWIITYGPMTLLGAGLFGLGIYLAKKG